MDSNNILSIKDIIKPSPLIFFKGVEDFLTLCLVLIEIILVSITLIFRSTTNCLKTQTSNPDAYRALVHFLRDEKSEFHTH